MSLARRFLRALSYFTILPVPSIDASPEPEDVALLPLVGTLVGATAGTIAYGTSRLFSPRVGAAVAFGAPIALTGALHLDGFLDVCDAAFAAVDVEKRHDILHDPRHGSFAFAGGALIAVASYAAIREIDPHDWPAALALCESIARFATLLAARTRAGSADATGTAARAFSKPGNDRTLAIEAAVILAGAHAYGGFRAVASAVIIIGGTIPIADLLSRRFGGRLGGDGYGFCIIVAHTAMLATCA